MGNEKCSGFMLATAPYILVFPIPEGLEYFIPLSLFIEELPNPFSLKILWIKQAD